MYFIKYPRFILFSFTVLLFFCHSAFASKILVNVSGIESSEGEIGCALFNDDETFPMDTSNAKQQWLKAELDGIQCEFNGVQAGSYAISVSHDLNRNNKVDTNFLGIPNEAWGVSNNIRPSLRAPTFEEAKFKLPDNDHLIINIKIDK